MSNSPPIRRRSRGNAWHWRQTDCWYFTPPGTKRRVRLLDEDGRPIRGKTNRSVAELALARIKVAGNWRPQAEAVDGDHWIVARVCSAYLENCKRRAEDGTIGREYFKDVMRYLNDFTEYSGALPVSELRKGHVQHWLDSHTTWRSPVTHRDVIAVVMAAFNYAEEMHEVTNPLRGLKKPPHRPRLHSLSAADEKSLYTEVDEVFRNLLFAAIHTGLRPYSELARFSAENVVETDRGMLWRVFASKTGKTRTIPVRSDVAELTRELIAIAANDDCQLVFRNSQGKPWKKAACVQRFGRIKCRLGWHRDPQKKHYSMYSCRHTFAHRMLAGYWNGGAGCSIEVLAELLGDTPKVAFDHYGREWGQHYQAPLWKAIGG